MICTHSCVCTCDQQDHAVEVTSQKKQRAVWVARNVTRGGILSAVLMDRESHFAKHLGVNLRMTQYSIYNEFYTTISCIIIMITFQTLESASRPAAAVPPLVCRGRCLQRISQNSRQGILQVNYITLTLYLALFIKKKKQN